MLVAIHQPHYLPWLGYIEKADRADVFVFLDTVDFSRGGWQNRNYIGAGPRRQLLSVPIRHSGAARSLDETPISYDRNWRRKHRDAILQAYASAAHAKDFREDLHRFYDRQWGTLAELGIDSSRQIFDIFGVRTECLVASELGPFSARKSGLLVEICQRLGATGYLTGDGSTYLDVAQFEAAGLRVVWQRFHHPVYRQGRQPFLSHLAGWDMLFHMGAAGALGHLREAQCAKVDA
ncbi:MAG: WbqC family protein [Rhodobacter sp.]|nr:WbqC family protein [Rhodobacter sp.]